MTIHNKHQLLASLRDEFNQWEELLAGMNEAQITAPRMADGLSIRDVIAHLRAWQTRSIAKLEAAMRDTEPLLPAWPVGLDPEADEDMDQINAWILDMYRGQPWSQVHQEWRDGFLRLLELGEAIPEAALMDAGRYAWMQGRPLAAVLQGSYEHHREEHREPLLAWLEQESNL